MNPDQWQTIEELYQAARKRKPAERAALLEQAAPELRLQVEAQLARDSAAPGMPDRPAQTPFGPGAQLGPYMIEALIGSGGMGEVFRARDTRLHRTVAIKMLPQDRLADADRQHRFLQEARAASALNHPNIVTLHDMASDRGVDFLVLEHVPGKTFKQMIPPGGLSIEDLWHYGSQIGSALGAAHAAGIVHRDIKPANIMITPGKQVKVLDFGLAKLTEAVGPEDETRTRVEHTLPGMIVGTVAYMSPEQTRGEPLDGRSDLFSLGSVLYEAATGRPPFQGPSTLAIMHEIAAGKPPAPSSFRADLPPELDRIIERALAKDKQDRYASAAELLEALQVLDPRSTTAVSTAKDRASAAGTAVGRPRSGVVAGLAVLLLLSAGTLAYYLMRPGSQIDSIAVLPFANVAHDPSLDYQADGLTEELINGFTQVPDLKVKGRTTVFRYKGKDLDPEAIGKQLEVRVVLMGKVVRNGDQVSVQADLVDTRDGSQLWGKQYNGTLAELQTIPGAIVQQVAGKIRVNGSDQKRLAKRRTVNPQAYDLYLQGRRALSEVTPDRIRQSMVYFQQAIARDPNYAAAYAGLADSYNYLGILEMAAPRDVMPKAKEAALKALELDSETAEAYTSLGIVQSVYEWDWAGSGKRFQRAMELNPGGSYDQHWYGHCLETMGQWQDAQKQMQKAVALDPLNPIPNQDLGYDFIINHRYDAAVQQLRRVVDLDPEDAAAHAYLALALEAKGLRSESLAENQRARQSPGGTTFVTGTVAGLYCRLGKPEEARKMLAELQVLAKQRYVAPLELAAIHFALGEREEGFRMVNAAVEDRSVNLQYNVTDPVFDSVRRDPRLIAVRNKLGLPEAAWAVVPFGK